MFFKGININLGHSERDASFPNMYKVHQLFNAKAIENPEKRIHDQCKIFFHERQLSGKTIAITVGSRGISELSLIVRTLIDELKGVGAHSFIVPAMGSHAGATAKGQKAFIESYGIVAKIVGVPIISDLSTIEIGRTEDGIPVYCDKAAYNSDGIIVLNKIKPHADFKGNHESGLLKMMAVGLGKHTGATSIHRYGFKNMAQLLPQFGKVFIEKAPILCGIAVLENQYDTLYDVEFVEKSMLIRREKELLVKAKDLLPRLQFPEIDILIIGEIGKNISGEGMDPNITGRPGSGLTEGFDAPDIQTIIVLDITRESHGNGVGIGMSDITTVGCVRKLDLSAMYTNAVTAKILNPVKIPLVANSDREAIQLAIKTCTGKKFEAPRIVWVKNTLEIGDLYISENLYNDVKNSRAFQVQNDILGFSFSEDDSLKGFQPKDSFARCM